MAKKKSAKKPLELYTDEQQDAIFEHIEKYFGEIVNVFSEKTSEYIDLKINVIPPNRKNMYYTLVTSGMGAHIMKIPKELKKKYPPRAELVLCLPPDWDLDREEVEYRWPLKLLSLLSRIPIEEDAWLGWGHSVDYRNNFASNTEYCSAMLIFSKLGEDSFECTLPDNEKVIFYQVVPLHRNELEFKHINGAAALVEKFTSKQLKIVDIERPSVIPDNFTEIIDTVESHSKKVSEKKLDTLEINGANHISAFLQWVIEHNMINDDF